MADLLITKTLSGLGMASIMIRKNVESDVLADKLGIPLPDGPAAHFSGTRTIVGTGPGSWLLVEEEANPDFAETLIEDLAGLASVSDQSSGYVMHQLSGEGARTLLQRGVAIDLHPQNFAAGSAATTLISHIGVLLWQVDEKPTYRIGTFRSFSDSFGHWLTATAATV